MRPWAWLQQQYLILTYTEELSAPKAHLPAQPPWEPFSAISAAKAASNAHWMGKINRRAVHLGKYNLISYKLIFFVSICETVLNVLRNRAVCTGKAPSSPVPTQARGSSYVPNSYFSFPYAPASFANSASCAAAASACSQNYDACITNLASPGYAVTVNVPGGGGTTVDGARNSAGSLATSICNSLSSEACYKATATKCDSFDKESSVAKKSAFSPLTLLAVFVLVTSGARFAGY